ncbi:MAG: hypothetical protein ACOC2W_02755 [bacterium]
MFKVDKSIIHILSIRMVEYLNKPFNVYYLYPDFIEKNEPTIFDGWVGKKLNTWHRLSNDEFELEFYDESYTIKNNKLNKKYELPIPKTIIEFINDCLKFDIELYWSDYIDKNFEPYEYLTTSQVIEYYKNLLNKMEKSNELLID